MANATFEVYSDKGGHYRWRLVSPNGQTTATSGEGFSSHESAKHAAESVKEHAATAEIVEARCLNARGAGGRPKPDPA